MIGTITAFVISYWFYKSAEEAGKKPLFSAGVGFFSYLIPCIAWTVFVTPGLRDGLEHNPGTVSGLFVNYAYILVGIGCAVAFKLMYFKPAQS